MVAKAGVNLPKVSNKYFASQFQSASMSWKDAALEITKEKENTYSLINSIEN